MTGASALRLIRVANDADYKVTLVFVGLTSAVLLGRRVLACVSRGGHAVPSEDLLRHYPAALVNLGKPWSWSIEAMCSTIAATVADCC